MTEDILSEALDEKENVSSEDKNCCEGSENTPLDILYKLIKDCGDCTIDTLTPDVAAKYLEAIAEGDISEMGLEGMADYALMASEALLRRINGR